MRVRLTPLGRSWLGIGALASACAFAPPARATTYTFSTFKGDTDAGELLSIYTSTDALNFTLVSDTGFGGSTGHLRDPSIIKHADGKHYITFTNPVGAGCCGPENFFSIASSADLIHWTLVTTVPAGVAGVARTWAPEWFIDDDGTVHIITNIDTADTHPSNFQPYMFTAQDTTLATWSGPVPLGIPADYIDAFIVKVKGTYHYFAKGTTYVEHATATALTGPWTFVGTGDWAGFGLNREGPALVQLDDGTWRIYLDGVGGSGFSTATSPDLMTWSPLISLPDGLGHVVRHGTVLRETPYPRDGGAGAHDAGANADAGLGTVTNGPQDADSTAQIDSPDDTTGTGAAGEDTGVGAVGDDAGGGAVDEDATVTLDASGGSSAPPPGTGVTDSGTGANDGGSGGSSGTSSTSSMPADRSAGTSSGCSCRTSGESGAGSWVGGLLSMVALSVAAGRRRRMPRAWRRSPSN